MGNTIIRVSTTSSPRLVAGAIAQSVRQQRCAEVQAIGAGAVNQMVKAVIVAGGYLEPEQIRPICLPTFVDVVVDGHTRTAVRLRIVAAERAPVAGRIQPAHEPS